MGNDKSQYWEERKKEGDKNIIQPCSPWIYHRFVRIPWFTKKYIHDQLNSNFHFYGKNALDFGSGTGANCTIFSPNQYVGIDPDAGRIQYAKRAYPEHSFHVLQNSTLPISDQSMDYILIVAVLHHIPTDEIKSYIKEFQRVLKKNGSIIVIEPYLNTKNRFCNFMMNMLDKGSYIRYEEDYLKMFQESGFRCEVKKRFRKCLVYNELFFSVQPN